MASVIGLAPIWLPKPCKSESPNWTICFRKSQWPDLKGRLRELLCIHGQKWSPRLVSRQRLLVFSEALICLSYSGNWLAEPKLGERSMVVPAGNAPASSGYQPGALLLSYETMVNRGFAPNRFTGRNTRFNRCVGRIRSARFGL